jgi:hypothetical protein
MTSGPDCNHWLNNSSDSGLLLAKSHHGDEICELCAVLVRPSRYKSSTIVNVKMADLSLFGQLNKRDLQSRAREDLAPCATDLSGLFFSVPKFGDTPVSPNIGFRLETIPSHKCGH